MRENERRSARTRWPVTRSRRAVTSGHASCSRRAGLAPLPPNCPKLLPSFVFPSYAACFARRSMSFLPVPVTRKAPTDLAPASTIFPRSFGDKGSRNFPPRKSGSRRWKKFLLTLSIFFSILRIFFDLKKRKRTADSQFCYGMHA